MIHYSTKGTKGRQQKQNKKFTEIIEAIPERVNQTRDID
jgi:hypothetical protein